MREFLLLFISASSKLTCTISVARIMCQTTYDTVLCDLRHSTCYKEEASYRMNRRSLRSFPYPQPYPQSLLVYNSYPPWNYCWGYLQITAIPHSHRAPITAPLLVKNYPLFRHVRKVVVKKTGNVRTNVIFRRVLANIVAVESNKYYILRVCVCGGGGA